MAPRKERFCKHGHDTFVTGRHSNNGCKVCMRVRAAENPENHERYVDTLEGMFTTRRAAAGQRKLDWEVTFEQFAYFMT